MFHVHMLQQHLPRYRYRTRRTVHDLRKVTSGLPFLRADFSQQGTARIVVTDF